MRSFSTSQRITIPRSRRPCHGAAWRPRRTSAGAGHRGRPQSRRNGGKARPSCRQAQRPHRERAGDRGRPIHGGPRPWPATPIRRFAPSRPPRPHEQRTSDTIEEILSRIDGLGRELTELAEEAAQPAAQAWAGPSRPRAGVRNIVDHLEVSERRNRDALRCHLQLRLNELSQARRRRRADGRLGAGRARVRGCSISPPA